MVSDLREWYAYVVLRDPLWTDNDVEVYDNIGEALAMLDMLRQDVKNGDEDGDFRIYRIEATDAAVPQPERTAL